MHRIYFEDSIGQLLGRTRRAFSNHLNRSFLASGLEINIDQFVILGLLFDNDNKCQQDLAVLTGKDKSSIARLLNNMERKGLITRRAASNDRRQKHINLTEKSNNLKDDISLLIEKTLRNAQQDIDPEKLQICKDVLKQIYKNVDNSKISVNL